jgi:hypothetical protein
MLSEDVAKLREALGLAAIEHELERIYRLLKHARHPSRTPEREYDDLEVMFDDDEEED